MKRARRSFDEWLDDCWGAVSVVMTLVNVVIWTYLLSQLAKAFS